MKIFYLLILFTILDANAQDEYLVPSVPRVQKIESELSSLAERVTALEKAPTPGPTATPAPPTPAPTAMPTPTATPPSGPVIETDGSQASVSSAISRAKDGDVVQLPAGNFTWTSGIEIKKTITLTGVAGATTITNSKGQGTLIAITPQASGSVELKDLKITEGSAGGSGSIHLALYNVPGSKPPLVHHCTFNAKNFGQRCIEWQNNGGVIYDCEFVSTNKADVSGIGFKNPQPTDSWTSPSSIGKAGDPDGTKNTYLEDCTFKNLFLQALDFDDNSRTVVRHCTFDNSAITSHGQDTSPQGVRQWEVCHNEFLFNVGGNCNPDSSGFPLNLNYWFYVRGGTGVIYANVIPAISSCYWGNKASISLTVFNIRRKSSYIPCQTSYPAARQFGFGSDSQGRLISEPVYIWGNTGSGATNLNLNNYDPDECGNNQQVSNYIKVDRDYFMSAKSSYQEYTYPHPARR